MKKFILLVLVVLFVITSTMGCNAMRGAGEDISNAGQHMQNAGK